MITFVSIADDIIQKLPFIADADPAALIKQVKLLRPDGWCVTHIVRQGEGDVEAVIKPDILGIMQPLNPPIHEAQS